MHPVFKLMFILMLNQIVISAPAVDQSLMGNAFKRYWYDQGAEISSYTVQQQRYGETRAAESVLIFVTEPLHQQQHIKSDNPNDPQAIPILKLNHLRSFNTGIYPYHIMQSVFQPIKKEVHNPALKINTSVQEWCGHVYEQWNLRDTNWSYELFSYFQSEGNVKKSLTHCTQEDELWTRIRINPHSIKAGEQFLIPGAIYRRFAHKDAKRELANIQFKEATNELRSLIISYKNIQRTLRIDFTKSFPHSIESWEERYQGGGSNGTLKKRIFGPYWEWNNKASASKRKDLELD